MTQMRSLRIEIYPIWGFMVGFGQFNPEPGSFRLMLGLLAINFIINDPTEEE